MHAVYTKKSEYGDDDEADYDDDFDDDDEFEDDDYDDYWDEAAEGGEQVCYTCLCGTVVERES